MIVNGTKLEVVRSSVLEVECDAIVNAANKAMRGGGALDGVIHRAAGREMLRELEIAAPRGAETAEVIVTKRYNLPHQYVFHVAGPVWSAKRIEECDELLAASYRNCLAKAVELSLQSLGFPSLSTGVYAFPIERAAPLAIQTAITFLGNNPATTLKAVTFAMFGGAEHHEFRRALEKLEI